MRKLFFENSWGERRVIAEVETEQEAIREIHAFVDEQNAAKPEGKKFKIYYTREWREGNYIKYDIGSHTEFFLFEIGDELCQPVT